MTSILPTTLHNRNHAVLGLRNVDTSNAKCDASFNISSSRCGSAAIVLDAAVNILDGVDVTEEVVVGGKSGENDGMSIDVMGIIS